MGVTCDWYDCDWLTNGRRVIVHHFDKHWTVDDLRRSAERAWELMRTVTYTVDVVLDLSEANGIPDNFLQLGYRIASKRPENAGIIVIATRLSLARALGNIFKRVYAVKFAFDFTSDLPSALESIRAFREANGYPDGIR